MHFADSYLDDLHYHDDSHYHGDVYKEIQGLFDAMIAEHAMLSGNHVATKQDVNQVGQYVRSAFQDLVDRPLAVFLKNKPLSAKGRGVANIWTPEEPDKAAKHLFPYLLQNLGPRGLVSRMRSIAGDMHRGGDYLLRPHFTALCNIHHSHTQTGLLLQKIKDAVKQKESTLAKRIPIYDKIKEVLTAIAQDKDIVAKMQAALDTLTKPASSDTSAEMNEAVKEAARTAYPLLLQIFTENRCLIDQMQSTIQDLERDLSRLASVNITDDSGISALDPPLRSYGGRRHMHLAMDGGFVDAMASAVLAGDMKILSLLDALDVDLTSQERVEVARAYARCSGGTACFKNEVEASLGGRGVTALKACGML
jgi:hypothetical protein